MAEEIKLKIKVTDDGTLKVTSRESKKAAKNLDKVAVSANTADRNLKGAAKASANSTKNFSKLQQGTGGLVGVYATLAAQVFAVSAAFQFLKSAADVSNLIKGQEALGAATGVAYKTITQSIKDATDGQLAYAEAARAAAIGTAAGLSPDQLEKIGSAAKSASFALGRDLTDSFNRLVRGITKAEPELLDELGITLRLADATQKYADAIGKNRDELTAYERSQAVANDVLTQAEKKFSAIEKIMDPTAGALNRFVASFDELLNSVKTGLTDALAPVFEFLSERTLALTASLALFAIPIVKSILPSFDKWEMKAQETLDIQKTKLDELGASYEKTRLDIESLGATQDKVLSKQTKSAGKVFKDLGIDTSKASSTGQKGVDFLAGGATSKQAQANADKILKNAEKQLKTSLEVRTGFLKGANAKQVADLRASYAKRAQILKKFEVTHASIWKRAGLQVKLYTTKSSIAWTRFQTLVVRGSKAMSKAVNGIFRIAGFVGVITLLYDLGKAAYDAFFPLQEEVKRAREEIEGFTSKSESLNKELARSANLVTNTNLLGLSEQVIAVGNAFSSANLIAQFRDFQALAADEEGYNKAKAGLQTTLDTLSKFSPEFEAAVKGIDLSNLTEAGVNNLIKLSEGFKKSGVNAQRLGDDIRASQEAIRAFAGKGTAVDPTIDLRRSLKTSSEGARQLANDLETQFGKLEADTSKSDELKAERDRIAAIRGTSSEFGFGFGSSREEEKAKQLAALQKQIDEASEAEQAALKALKAERQAELEQARKVAKVEEDKYNIFQKAAPQFVENQKKITTLRKAQASLDNLGVTFAQKRNLISKQLVAFEEKKLVAQDKLLRAETALEAANAESAENKEAAVAAAQAAVDAAQEEVDLLNIQAPLEAEKARQQQIQLDRQERQLRVQKENLAIQRSLFALELQKSRASSGGLGVFGIAQQRQIVEATRAVAAEKVKQEEKSLQDATLKLAEARLGTTGDGRNIDENAVAQAQQELQVASQKLQTAREDKRVANSTAQIYQEQVAAQTESLALQNQVISLNPIQERFNQLKLEALQEGNKLEELNIDFLMEQAKAQAELILMTEQKQKLFDSIESNLTSAITSVIDGTSSLKDAFANLAVSILKDLAAMIAKMLVFKALSSIPGLGFLGFENGGIAGGGFQAFAMGGIAQGGIAMGAYSSGGIVNRPTIGLVGEGKMNEAIVPLPDGKSIPVMMNGGSNSNVVVNVSIDNNGNSRQNTSADESQGASLGNAIAVAVQRELQNQKRSGGILNPYGAS